MGKMIRYSFIFYRSFYEALRDLPRDIQGEIYTAIMEYSLYGKETENLKPISRSVLTLIKHYIDRQGKQGMFKGANSNENAIIRSSIEMKECRKRVFERDNYTCMNCGKVGGNLNAHHIKPFSVYPKLRFELSNGLTLCKSCHINLHKKEREWNQ